MNADDAFIHMVDWSSQPDLLFRCDGAWSTPDWKQSGEDPTKLQYLGGIYLADNGRRYTFDKDKITCPVCLRTAPRSPE
jgi:hypothetical protein